MERGRRQLLTRCPAGTRLEGAAGGDTLALHRHSCEGATMIRRRGMLFAVVLVASTGLAASPAAAKGTATVPGAPAITGFTQGKRSVTVAFTAPASNGGAAIIGYRLTCRPTGSGENKFGFSHKSPVITGSLAANKSYVCTLLARNRIGFGPPSAPITISVSGGTTCAQASGSTTFAPALPKLGVTTTVDSVLTLNGTIGGCVGGGVTGGTMTAVSLPINDVSCNVLVRGTAIFTTTATITWNTNATSTIALQIQQTKKITDTTLAGTVTAGLFQGLHLSGLSIYQFPAGACSAVDLSTLTYRQFTSTVIA